MSTSGQWPPPSEPLSQQSEPTRALNQDVFADLTRASTNVGHENDHLSDADKTRALNAHNLQDQLQAYSAQRNQPNVSGQINHTSPHAYAQQPHLHQQQLPQSHVYHPTPAYVQTHASGYHAHQSSPPHQPQLHQPPPAYQAHSQQAHSQQAHLQAPTPRSHYSAHTTPQGAPPSFGAVTHQTNRAEGSFNEQDHEATRAIPASLRQSLDALTDPTQALPVSAPPSLPASYTPAVSQPTSSIPRSALAAAETATPQTATPQTAAPGMPQLNHSLNHSLNQATMSFPDPYRPGGEGAAPTEHQLGAQAYPPPIPASSPPPSPVAQPIESAADIPSPAPALPAGAPSNAPASLFAQSEELTQAHLSSGALREVLEAHAYQADEDTGVGDRTPRAHMRVKRSRAIIMSGALVGVALILGALVVTFISSVPTLGALITEMQITPPNTRALHFKAYKTDHPNQALPEVTDRAQQRWTLYRSADQDSAELLVVTPDQEVSRNTLSSADLKVKRNPLRRRGGNLPKVRDIISPTFKAGERYQLIIVADHDIMSARFTELCATFKTSAHRQKTRGIELALAVQRGKPSFSAAELETSLALAPFTLHDTPAAPFSRYLDVRWREGSVSFVVRSQSSGVRRNRDRSMKLSESKLKREPQRIKRVMSALTRSGASVQGVTLSPRASTPLRELVLMMSYIGDYPISIVPPTDL